MAKAITMKTNQVAHFEIYANDPDKLGKFYTSLFDWDVEKVPGMDYTLIKTVDTDTQGRPSNPGGINGGLMKRPAGYEDRAWINYVNVDLLEESVQRAQELGAKVMKGKQAVPSMGWFSILSDPEDNIFALWQTDPNAK